MGENRFFYVESKSFEIVKNAIELSLIERSRNHFSIVTMGFVAALWLFDVLLEVAKLSNDQNLFRSFREGNKIFVLQKQRNGKGRFVTISALGDSKSKGYVIISEGRDACGWHGLSQEINNIMAAQNHGNREVNQHRPQSRHLTVQGNQDPNMVKESRTFKEAVTQGDMPNILIGIAGNQGLCISVNLRSPVVEFCQPEDAITQKLVHWVSLQQEAIESDVDDDVGDFEGEVLGLENGFDSVGALSSCEAVGSFEGNGNELSMVLAEEKETSGGLNDRGKRLCIKNLIQDWQADIIYLQETKLKLITDPLVRSLWRCRYVDWLFLGSSGASGGILLMWDSRVVEKIEGAVGYFSVSCKFKNVEDQQVRMFTGVYGPNINSDRRLMWDELAGIRNWWDVPWCLGGDFNMVRFPVERVGSANFSTSMHDFSDFISSNGLIDIPLTMCIIQKRLDRLNSDHFPIALECGNIQKRRRPFRFENMWLMAEGEPEKWNETEFGNVNVQKKTLLAGLRKLDVVADARPLSAEEKGKGEQLAVDLEKFRVVFSRVLEAFRQGDPLSPMLFVIVMEAFSRLIVKATGAGMLTGFSMGSIDSDPLEVSHLLFANDTLIFFGEVPCIEELADILGCKTSKLPMKYLGAKFKAKDIWNSIVEKMERRLAGWKRIYLSKGGRLTLIKSTLSNLPTYFFISSFLFQLMWLIGLKKSRGTSYGGTSEEVAKFHLVKWDMVCSPYSHGGLAIKNLRRFNEALLGKWLWRFGVERDAFWRKVIMVKYGSLDGGWMSKAPSGLYGVGLWKFIQSRWVNFSKFVTFEVGDGSLIRFWDDVWCGEEPLKLAYPELYRIACVKDGLVADFVQCRGHDVHWEVTFTRLAQD
uniref:Reverse transcriptase domain-containing protein n=1 Tax=Fagus sylvatica TaxID=28930 RepID=A0A2N9EVU3_FAGSY